MKIGIVLSGGAAHGIAHIGILKALGEMGMRPAIISGVSAGAIVGAYYAAGFKEDEILEFALTTNLFRISDFNLGYGGMFKSSSLKESLDRHLKGLTFEQLQIPLIVTATDFINVESIYFTEGELIPALLASSAIPGIYKPVEFNGLTLVDGGLLNNFPVEPLKKRCDLIIGSNVNSIEKDIKKLNLRNIIARSLLIAVSNTVTSKKQECAMFIEPPAISHFGLFDMNNTRTLFEIGYNYTMGLQDKLEKVLKTVA